MNTWKISGMLIVYWPITIKFRTREQTSKPLTNYSCCLRFSYLAPYWLICRNTITFHKYFWCSRFCVFHSKCNNFKGSSTNPDSLVAPICLFFESPFGREASLQLFRKPTKFTLQKETNNLTTLTYFRIPLWPK